MYLSGELPGELIFGLCLKKYTCLPKPLRSPWSEPQGSRLEGTTVSIPWLPVSSAVLWETLQLREMWDHAPCHGTCSRGCLWLWKG